jgi:membrane protein YdbS with pleckstrin-like domain
MEKSKQSQDIGFFTILFLIFLTLKLAGLGVVADWSWWWVTAPLWLPIVAALIVLAVAAFIKLIAE